MIPTSGLWCLRFVLIAGALALSSPASAKQMLFGPHEPLDIVIEAPFSKINNDRRDDPEYRAGQLTYVLQDGASQVLDLKIRTRGIFRRQRETCEFPPLRLNFRKKQVVGTLFHGQDKLKLVTHCLRNDDKAQQNVLKEYLAYRIFNEMTPRSFQVRLLNVTYVDTAKRGRRTVNAGFVIEHKNAMADRNQAEVQDEVRIRSSELNTAHANLVEVFQYLIGNTDFSMSSGSDQHCCHNMVPIGNGNGEYYIVPYDFDFAGMVDPGYARPNPKLHLRDVKQRLYRGLCRSNETLPATLAQFNDARPRISALPGQVFGMSERNQRSTIRYLDTFYDAINDAKKRQARLIDRCR